MRRLFIIGLALLWLAPAVDARRKRAKAGKIADNVYTDAAHGFQLSLHDNWKAKVGKAKDATRLRLTQRNYAVPADYIDAPDYTKIPMVSVYVDTTSFPAHTFIDSLTGAGWNTDQKKSIRKEFEVLNEPEIIPKTRSRLELAGQTALLWRGQAKYRKQVQTSAGSISGKFVNSSYGGAIIAVKMDDSRIVLFHVMTEWTYFEPVMTEVMTILSSLTFPEPDDEG